MCEQREEVLSQLTDSATVHSYQQQISFIRNNWNKILQVSQRSDTINALTQGISQLLKVIETTTTEFTSGLVLQNQSNQEQNLDFLYAASERLKKAVRSLYNASKNLRVNYQELVFDSKPLGEGNFGTVWKAMWKSTPVAVKKIKKDKISDEDYQAFINEATLMMKIGGHPNTVMMLGVCEEPLCLLFEYVEHGSLENILQDKNYKPISIQQKCKWMLEIAEGMLHLQNNNIIHSDLASRNVLVFLLSFFFSKLKIFQKRLEII